MTVRRIDLPWSCAESSNQRDRYGHGGGYTLARDETAAEASNQVDGDPWEGPVEVRIDVIPPSDPSPLELSPPFDVMNLPKAILDGLEGAVYENDRQVVVGHVYQRDASGSGAVIVQAQEIDGSVEDYIVGADT